MQPFDHVIQEHTCVVGYLSIVAAIFIFLANKFRRNTFQIISIDNQVTFTIKGNILREVTIKINVSMT